MGQKNQFLEVVISISLAELRNRVFIDSESNLLRKISDISKWLYYANPYDRTMAPCSQDGCEKIFEPSEIICFIVYHEILT